MGSIWKMGSSSDRQNSSRGDARLCLSFMCGPWRNYVTTHASSLNFSTGGHLFHRSAAKHIELIGKTFELRRFGTFGISKKRLELRSCLVLGLQHAWHCIAWHCIALRIAVRRHMNLRNEHVLFGVWRQCPRHLMQMKLRANHMVLILTTSVSASFCCWGIAHLLSLFSVACSTSFICMVVETYGLCGACLIAQDRPSSSRRPCWFMRETIGDALC